MLKPNIQLFAEPDDGNGQTPAPDGGTQTFTADYVKTLRGESANYRNTAKTYEASLRKVLGVKDGEDLGDLNARMAAYNQNLTKQQQDALNLANSRLVKAEIRSLEGYDHKLLEKVIDRKNIKVDDNGNVTGLKEAAEAAAKEFPAVLVKTNPDYSPENPGGAEPPQVTAEDFLKMSYEEKLKLKQDNPTLFKKLIGGNI